jgi:Ca2+-binding EF-hand superfamily protein
MSTISGLGGANRSWDTGQQQTRKAEREAKMFAKVDTDGNGSVDATELASMLKKGDASSDVDSAALLKQMDTDGNGSLSADELSKGMHDLMPRPSSTMDFAQTRSAANDDGGGDADAFAKLDTDGDGKLSRAEFEAGRNAGGPHTAGGPPPAQASAGSSTSTSATSSASFDPLDTNQDGTVSQIERLAGQLKELAQAGSDATAQGSGSEIAALAQKLYDQISKNWLQPGAQTSVSQVNATA